MADNLILLPIYPARELPIPGVTSELIAEKVQSKITGASGKRVFGMDKKSQTEWRVWRSSGDGRSREILIHWLNQ